MIKKKQLQRYLSEKYWFSKHQKSGNFFSFIVITVISFINKNCFDKAATLTFYSLLSIVPLLAIGFGIAEQFGWEESFTQQIKEQFETQPEIAEKIIQFSISALKQTKGSIIAFFGLLVLIWTVFRMIVNVAIYFNEIWGISSQRTLWHQMRRFLPLILLFPVFLVAANSFLLYFSTLSYGQATFFGPIVARIFALVPFIIVALLLTFIYIYIPNAKVPLKSGIIAGIVATLLYQLWQWIYISFQVKSSSYGAIYGSFAAIPLFLIWLNYSWLIILFGTELSFQISKIRR